MNKKLKIGLIVSCLSFTGLSAGIASLIALSTNSIYKSNNYINGSGDGFQIKGEKTSFYGSLYANNDSSSSINQIFKTKLFSNIERNTTIKSTLSNLTLKINEMNDNFGNITFVDGTTSKNVSPGDKVQLKIIANKNYQFVNLKISFMGNEIESAPIQNTDTTSESKISLYEFEIPNITYTKDLLDSFYFQAYFSKKNDENNSGVIDTQNSYIYKLTKDTALDDNISCGLKSEFEKMGNIAKVTNKSVEFVVMLNGYQLSIGTFHIPTGCNVTFLNNSTDTQSPKAKVVPLENTDKSILYTNDVVYIWRSANFSQDIYIMIYE